jgi:hypothetical protein
VSPPSQAGVGPGGIDAVGVVVVLKKPKPPTQGRAALDPGAAATTAAGFAATATTAGTTVAPAAGRPFPYRDESSVTIEDFSGPTSARGAKCRGVLASRASEGQGELSARGLNRNESGIGWGSGHF